MASIGVGERILAFLFIIWAFNECFTSQLTLLATSALIGLALWQQKRALDFWKRLGIPAPEGNFFLGNTLDLFRNGTQKFQLEYARKFGNCYGCNVMGKPVLVVSNFTILREILIRNFGSFMNRPHQPQFDGQTNILHYMLVALRDQRWKQIRWTISPYFTTGRLRRVFTTINECAKISVGIVRENIENGNSKFVTRKVLGNFVMDIIAKTAFGLDGNFQTDENCQFMRMANKLFQFSFTDPKIIFMILFPNLTNLIRSLRGRELINDDLYTYFIQIVQQTIAKRLKDPEKKYDDFLQLVIESSIYSSELQNGQASGSTPSDLPSGSENREKACAQCFLFIAAGFETTTTALECAFYSLAVNPAVQQKAYDEAVTVLGDKETIGYDDLSKLQYIGQIAMESLRMYPPISRYDRECGEAINLVGLSKKLPKHLPIMIPIFAIHYSEDYYENPEKFDPERFSPDRVQARDPFAFCPFGHGPRQCIGMRYAIQNMRLIIAFFIRKFEFKANGFTQGAILELNTFGFTKPARPIILDVQLRE